jgi:hypothetical protein
VRLGMGCVVLCATLGFTSSAVGQKQTELPFRLIDGWAVLVQGTLGGVPNREILTELSQLGASEPVKCFGISRG